MIVHMVSIQLVSPASGEEKQLVKARVATLLRFHSISFPSEWGAEAKAKKAAKSTSSFHSISFPSEWGVRERN